MDRPQALSGRSQFLDIVRGCAILGVLWQHTYSSYFALDRGQVTLGGVHFYPFIFNNGFLGVNIFFVVSGFVLFNPAMLSVFSAGDYLRKRAMRLLPLYVVVLLFIFCITSTSVVHKMMMLVLLLSGVHDLIPTLWEPRELPVLWTLGVEILFSLMLPLFVILFKRMDVIKLSIAVLVLCFIYRIIGDAIFYAIRPHYLSWSINPLKDNILGRLDDFFVGMSASWLYAKGVRPPTWLFAAALAGVAAASYAWNVISVSQPSAMIFFLASAANPLLSLSLAVVILRLTPFGVWRSAWFFPVRLLGQCCYSIYLVHAVILDYFWRYIQLSNPLSALAYFAVTLACSLVLFLGVETLGLARKPGWVMWFIDRRPRLAARLER